MVFLTSGSKAEGTSIKGFYMPDTKGKEGKGNSSTIVSLIPHIILLGNSSITVLFNRN